MRTNFVLSAFLLTFLASRAAAQTDKQQRPIWAWDDDTRIAQRLDPAAITQRLAAHTRQMATHPSSGRITAEQASDAPAFVIDGDRNPELFLPFELFETLLNAIDPGVGDEKDRRALHERYEPHLRALGFDSVAFWTDLSTVARLYLTARSNRDTVALRADSASPEERRQLQARLATMPVELCRARFETLNRARAHFGPSRFDEFLYTAVAPTLHVASSKPSAGAAGGLKMLAGGCHH